MRNKFCEEGFESCGGQHHPDALLLDYRLPDQERIGIFSLATAKKNFPSNRDVMTPLAAEEIAVLKRFKSRRPRD